MKKNLNFNYHTCYDELLSKLFLMTYEERKEDNNTQATNSKKGTMVSLVSDRPHLIERYKHDNVCQFYSRTITKVSKETIIEEYDNSFDLTAHEIIIYSLLLSKCIENQSEEQEISYKELQLMRNKRVGKSTLLDDKTFNAFNHALVGLAKKTIKYDLLNSRKNKKITYRKGEHPLLIINDVENFPNRDKIIKYSLGKFGKTLIESKRYSTLVPDCYFTINFNEIMYYQIALYICKLIYINQRKKTMQMTLQLNSVMKNTNKWIISEEYGIIKYCCSLYYYNGENTRRYGVSTINRINEILNQLKVEQKIKNFNCNYEIQFTPYMERYNFRNVKWYIEFNK